MMLQNDGRSMSNGLVGFPFVFWNLVKTWVNSSDMSCWNVLELKSCNFIERIISSFIFLNSSSHLRRSTSLYPKDIYSPMKFKGRSLIRGPISSLTNAFLMTSKLFRTRKFLPFNLNETILPYCSFHLKNSKCKLFISISKKHPKNGRPYGPGGYFFFFLDVMVSRAANKNHRNDPRRHIATSISHARTLTASLQLVMFSTISV